MISSLTFSICENLHFDKGIYFKYIYIIKCILKKSLKEEKSRLYELKVLRMQEHNFM